MPGSTTGALNPEPLEKAKPQPAFGKRHAFGKRPHAQQAQSLWKKAVAVAGRAAFGKRQ